MTVLVKGKCARTWPTPRKRKAHPVMFMGNQPNSVGICLNCGRGFFRGHRR